jgi:hypothetical protein
VTLPPWSYSHLSTADNCLHQYFHRFVVKDAPYVESPQQKAGKAVHEALAARIAKKRRLPDEFSNLEAICAGLEEDGYEVQAELKLGIRLDRSPCGFFDKDVWGRCVVDVVQFNGEAATVWDWKNGTVREDPLELKIQAAFLKAKYPHLKRIVGRYMWLQPRTLGVGYDLSDIEAHWKTITERIMELVLAHKLDNWPKNPTPLCGWCEVFSCEHNRAKR